MSQFGLRFAQGDLLLMQLFFCPQPLPDHIGILFPQKPMPAKSR
jgi:hypothetical protein